MSITDNYQPDKSLGNGVTAIFTGSWKVLNADYFQMRLENVVTGVQTLLTRGVDYSLTFNDAGYTATFLGSPPTSANYIIRSRQVTLDQIVPYRTSKGFQGEVQENSFDKLTAIEQDQQDQIDRSLKFKIGSSSAGYEIEDPINGRGLMWDTVNNRIVNTDTDIDTIIADVEAAVAAAAASAAAAAGSQSSAATSATASEDWAKKINGSVDGSEYSSKAYAIGGVGVTNGVGRGAAKEWATKIGGTVDGTEYSAKKYASDAQGFAAAAAAAAAEGLYNNVDSINFANSPYVPLGTQEGWLFRCDTTSGNMVINLSALSVYGQDMKFGFVKIDNSANTITINRGGTDTINGATSAVISTQFETHVIVGDLQTGSWIDTVQTTGVPNGSITNAKLANMNANTVKANATAGSAAPTDVALTADTVLGRRGANITAVPIGTGANNLVSLDGSSKLPAVDGSQLTNLPVGLVIVRTVYTAGATWTKDAKLLYADVEVQGAGGGSGGTGSGTGTWYSAGGGGGGYSRKVIAASDLGATETVTVGTGGTGTTGAGGTGGTSSFGSHCSATGGAGSPAASSSVSTTGGNGGVGSNGNDNRTGQAGLNSAFGGTTGGAGGNGFLGMGGKATIGGSGTAGIRGGGGGGISSTVGSGAVGGGGVVIVTEYRTL